jgi:hypothetical protein
MNLLFDTKFFIKIKKRLYIYLDESLTTIEKLQYILEENDPKLIKT